MLDCMSTIPCLYETDFTHKLGRSRLEMSQPGASQSSASTMGVLALLVLVLAACRPLSCDGQSRASFVDTVWTFLRDTYSYIIKPIVAKGR